jgi:hypothetical protein
MSDRPTPETDATIRGSIYVSETFEFCRQLERERDEAREAVKRRDAVIERLRMDLLGMLAGLGQEDGGGGYHLTPSNNVRKLTKRKE